MGGKGLDCKRSDYGSAGDLREHKTKRRIGGPDKNQYTDKIALTNIKRDQKLGDLSAVNCD